MKYLYPFIILLIFNLLSCKSKNYTDASSESATDLQSAESDYFAYATSQANAYSASSSASASQITSMMSKFGDTVGVWQIGGDAYVAIFSTGGTYYIQTFFPSAGVYGEREKVIKQNASAFYQPSSGETFVINQYGNLSTYINGDFAGEWIALFGASSDDIDYYVDDDDDYIEPVEIYVEDEEYFDYDDDDYDDLYDY